MATPIKIKFSFDYSKDTGFQYPSPPQAPWGLTEFKNKYPMTFNTSRGVGVSLMSWLYVSDTLLNPKAKKLTVSGKSLALIRDGQGKVRASDTSPLPLETAKFEVSQTNASKNSCENHPLDIHNPGGLLQDVTFISKLTSPRKHINPNYVRVRLGRNKIIFVFHKVEYINAMKEKFRLDNVFSSPDLVEANADFGYGVVSFDWRDFLELHIPFPANAKYDWNENPPSRNKVGVSVDLEIPQGLVLAGIFLSRNGAPVEISSHYGKDFYSFLGGVANLEFDKPIENSKDPEAVMLRYYTVAAMMGMLSIDVLSDKILTPDGMRSTGDFRIEKGSPFEEVPILLDGFSPSCTLDGIVYAWDGKILVPAVSVVDTETAHSPKVFLEHQKALLDMLSFNAKTAVDIIEMEK